MKSMSLLKMVNINNISNLGFSPKDSFEIAKADMIVDGIADLMAKATKAFFEQDEEVKVWSDCTMHCQIFMDYSHCCVFCKGYIFLLQYLLLPSLTTKHVFALISVCLFVPLPVIALRNHYITPSS